MHEILANRPMSGFPVSIGTGLALETLFSPVQPVYDETRITPDHPVLGTYTVYVFNVSTLLRNLITSVPFRELVVIPKSDIMEAMLEEIEFITNFFESNSLCAKFYINNYQYVKTTYGATKSLRKSSTDHQFFIDSIYDYCLNTLKKEDDVTLFVKDIRYDRTDSALILTHVPFDLIGYANFVRLDLLESNTGKIKPRQEWNTKYHRLPDGRDMSFLPFMEYLLVTFGDNVMFKPAAIDARYALYDSFKKKGVNPLSSELTISFLRS